MPVLIYVIREKMHLANLPLLPYHYYIQTFISGPCLFILGLILLVINRKNKSKYAGWLIMIFGLFWTGLIIKTVLEEAQVI